MSRCCRRDSPGRIKGRIGRSVGEGGGETVDDTIFLKVNNETQCVIKTLEIEIENGYSSLERARFLNVNGKS